MRRVSASKESRGASNNDSKHLFIILHGKKGGDPDLRAAIEQLRDDGHEISVRVTYEGPDMSRYVGEALSLKDKVDVIVAAGGDGSINQAVAALIEHDAPEDTAFAIIPMGTANDFAKGLGIPEEPWEALEVAVHRPAEELDVGLVNGRVFINVATGGFGTELTVKTDEEMKKNIGGAAYAITGLTSFGSITSKAATLKAKVVDTVRNGERSYEIAPAKTSEHLGSRDAGGEHVDIEGDLLILAVGNGRQAGGGVRLCSQAVLNDGLLDVTYVMNLPPDRIPDLLKSLINPSELESQADCFGSLRVPTLEVECKEGLQVNVDGEPMHDTKFKFEVLPKRLRLHVPDAKLLTDARDEDKEKGQEKFKKELDREEKRPEKEETPFWRKPLVRSIAQNVFVLGVGVSLGALFRKPVNIRS